MTDLTSPIYNDEEAARRHYEAIRWPEGPICPKCGSINNATELHGKSTRAGVYKCKDCQSPFTVTVGTLFERSHIPLHKWLLAVHLLTSSKKGMSAHQLYRMLGFGSYRTAWFMAHRIRESFRELFPEGSSPLGGEGATVEIDETYIGGKATNRHKHQRGMGRGRGFPKAPVFALVERDGRARAFHVPEVTGENLRSIVRKHVAPETTIYSDEGHTTRSAAHGYKTDTVNHQDGEYVRDEVYTNTVEGYFATLKRGIMGTYHHVSEQHLDRYLAEFSFRHSNRAALGVEDSERAVKALQGVAGKRLTYRQRTVKRTNEQPGA
jgi:transposase-like protein